MENTIKNIKAVALDLDGTLLSDDHTISTANKNAVKAVELQGKKIVITTGRSYRALLPYALDLGINGPVVCYNGAAVYQHPSGEKLIEYPLSEKWAPILIEKARENNIHLHFFIDEIWYYENEREEVETYSERCGFKGVLKNFDDISNLSCTKAMFVGEPEALQKIYKELKNEIGEGIYMAFSSSTFLEIMRKGVSKAKALKETLESQNIQLSEVIAFGDGMNDLEMIQQTALGYAMSNGSEGLKKATPFIAPPNSENGVSQVLKELFLND
jgi:Cof subfamily protein (haloacid dehalogenase superfamily)